MSHQPEITRFGIFALQVCVPSDWKDEQIEAFTKEEHARALHSEMGDREMPVLKKIIEEQAYAVIHEGDPMLRGDPERVPCDDHPEMIHCLVAIL